MYLDKFEGRELIVSSEVLYVTVQVSRVMMTLVGSMGSIGVSDKRIGRKGGGGEVAAKFGGNGGTGSGVCDDFTFKDERNDGDRTWAGGGGWDGSRGTWLTCGSKLGSTKTSSPSATDKGSGGNGGLFGDEERSASDGETTIGCLTGVAGRGCPFFCFP